MLKLLILATLCVHQVLSFSLQDNRKIILQIQQGQDFILSCTVDNYYEWCTFRKNARKCDFEWKRALNNIATIDCHDFKEKADFHGNYNNHECAIKVKNATFMDSGIWTCDLESYHFGFNRGDGFKVRGAIEVKVLPLMISSTSLPTIVIQLQIS